MAPLFVSLGKASTKQFLLFSWQRAWITPQALPKGQRPPAAAWVLFSFSSKILYINHINVWTHA